MALPRWRIQIHKSLATAHWSNDYLTDDDTIEDAQDLSALLLTWEQQLHMDIVNFDYILISSYGAGRVFRHITVNEPGIVLQVDYMPLFNTVRIDLETTNSDPARKYYRYPVAEGNSVNGVLTPSYITGVNSVINTYLVTPDVLSHIVTTKGNNCVDATVHPFVQMRQQNRRRRKKVTP